MARTMKARRVDSDWHVVQQDGRGTWRTLVSTPDELAARAEYTALARPGVRILLLDLDGKRVMQSWRK